MNKSCKICLFNINKKVFFCEKAKKLITDNEKEYCNYFKNKKKHKKVSRQQKISKRGK